MKPHLVRWHKDYSEKGLVVIDVDNGKLDTREAVQTAVEKGSLPYAVLWDKDARNCDAYGVKAYPSAYLIGVDGAVVWEGVPNPKNDEMEKALKAELEKVKK